MTKPLGSVGKDTVIYAAGVGISRLAGFLMLPIYTRFLAPADYGVLELLSTTVELIGTIAGVGLVSGVFKFHSEYEDPSDKREVVSTAAIAILALSTGAALAGILGAGVLNGVVFPQGNGRPIYFRLFFVMYLFQQAELVPLLLLRIHRRPILFVTLSVGKLVLMLGLNIYFVVVQELGVLGVLLGGSIATGVSALILTTLLVRAVPLRFSRHKFVRMVIFGSPMIFWFLGSFVIVFSDRYFLNHYSDTSSVGIYGLAYRFAGIITALGFRPFQMVWDPHRYDIAKQEDSARVFRQAFTYLNLVFAGLALGIALFVHEVLIVMVDNPSFVAAYTVVPILLVAQIVYHWSAYANLGLYMNDRTPRLAAISGAGAVAVIVLNVALIPRYGVYGAAVATLIAYSLRFGAIYVLAQREVHLSYDWWSVAKLYGICFVAVALKFALAPESLLAATLVAAVLALSATVGVYCLVLSAWERSALRAFVASVPARLRRSRQA